jgi:hypothetical protein
MTRQPAVFVIVLNWNRPDDTLECVESIRNSTYGEVKIVIVDNGSSDDSVKRFRSAAPDCTLLETHENSGFTGANNLAMRYVLTQAAGYLLLLNNDTVIASDAIERMVACAEADERVGIVTSKIRFYDPERLIWFGGARYDPRFVTGSLVGYRCEDHGQFDMRRDIPFATGCVMLIRRSVVERVGELWSSLFLVMEDLDYSLRVRRNGYRIVYEPAAVVWHKEAASSGGHDAPQYVYYQTRNFLMLRQRWATGAVAFVLAYAYAFAYFAKRSLRFMLERKWRSLAAIALGISDALRGISGRQEHPLLQKTSRAERTL